MDPGDDGARIWIAVATLSHPACDDRERANALLAMLGALDRQPDSPVTNDAAPAVATAAREAGAEDSELVARLAVEWLERAAAIEPLAALAVDGSQTPGLRRRAAYALVRAGGEPARARLALAAAADPDLASLACAVLSAPLGASGPAAGPHVFSRGCRACFGDLLHVAGIDVMTTGGDLRRISLWVCRGCHCSVESDSARPPRFFFEQIAAPGFEMLRALLEACPRPRDPSCPCEAHRNLGRPGPADVAAAPAQDEDLPRPDPPDAGPPGDP